MVLVAHPHTLNLVRRVQMCLLSTNDRMPNECHGSWVQGRPGPCDCFHAWLREDLDWGRDGTNFEAAFETETFDEKSFQGTS